MKERIVEMMKAAMEGRWEVFRRVGIEVIEREGEAVLCSPIMRVGILGGDSPVSTAVQVLFALFGPYWPQVEEAKEALNESCRKANKGAPDEGAAEDCESGRREGGLFI